MAHDQEKFYADAELENGEFVQPNQDEEVVEQEENLNEVDDIYDVQAEYEKMLADWEDYEDTDNNLYVLVNSLASNSVNNAFTKIQQEILNDYVYTGSSVVKYTDAYADLVAE